MTADKLAELEAAAGEDPAQLAVYADALQSQGDPRGELIAIDLHAAANGGSRELDDRRAAVMTSWLGSLAGDPGLRFTSGFLELVCEPGTNELLLARLLGGPGGPYLRTLELFGDRRRLAQAASLLALAPRPRLRVLAITASGHQDNAIITAKLGAAIIRATPALDTLVARGWAVFGAFPHPRLRRVRVAGWNALGSLAGAGPALEALTELDFAFHPQFVANVQLRGRARERLLRGVPALTRLDLSRNVLLEPFAYAANGIDVFAFLRDLSIKRQLTHLTLPGPSAGNALVLQGALDRMPALERLELTQAPAVGVPELGHRTATISAAAAVPPGPWLDARRDQVIVEPLGHPHRVVLEPWRIVPVLAAAWEAMPAPAREGWSLVWNALTGLPWEGPTGRPAPVAVTVRHVMEALTIDGLDPAWCALRDILHARVHELPGTIGFRRWHGW